MTETPESMKDRIKDLQINLSKNGNAMLSADGVKLAEFSPDGSVVVYTSGAVQTKPAAAAVTTEDKQISISVRNFSTFVVYGATLELAADGGITVYTNLTVETKPILPKEAGVADAGGNKGFRVPTKAELNVLFQHKDKGALKDTFNVTSSNDLSYYWSSTSSKPSFFACAWGQNFYDGKQVDFHKLETASIRFIR